MSNLNGFSVSVPEAQEETTDGYVVLRHGENFRIRLHNNHKDCGVCKNADAEVYLQGKYVGTYRVSAGQTVILEHPLDDSGKFTAFRNGTQEARQAEINPDSPDNGLIKVVWKPGTKKTRVQWVDPYPHYDPWYVPVTYTPCRYDQWKITCTDNTRTDQPITRSISTTTNSASLDSSVQCSYNAGSNDLCGGGIGLSGHSDQKFTETDALTYDESSTTMYLRIAFRDQEARPIKATKVYKTCTNVPRPLR